MDWTAAVDAYCERLGPEFWAEPLNAVTNLAFLIAALWGARAAGRQGDRAALGLAALLGLIGIGSFLFHTVAQRWAGLADVLPILGFILAYVWIATRRFFGAGWLVAALAVLAYFPVTWGVAQAVRAGVGSLNGSEGYGGALVLLLAYGFALLPRHRATGGRLLIGAGIFTLSLTARSLDGLACPTLPVGTHFLWHLLNALLLGWMIHTALAHAARVARDAGRG